MKRAIKTFNVNLVLLIFFSMLVMVSAILMLLKASEFRVILGNLETRDFQVMLTPGYIIVKNPYSNIAASYSISTLSNTASPKKVFIEVFPLKLPRKIEAYNETMYLGAWDFNVYNVLCINYTEVERGHVLQKAYAISLSFHLELLYDDSNFRMILETVETPHGPVVNKTLSGFLKPLTGQLYGGFFFPSGESIRMILEWEPSGKPIVAVVYHESGRFEAYLLTGGKWSGSLKVVDTGLNCIIVGNLDQNENVTYSGTIINHKP